MPHADAHPLNRRRLLIGAVGLAAGPAAAQAPEQRPAAVTDLETALKKILGDAKPVDGKLKIETPEIAENGNTVPYSVSLDSPMTEENHVKALHILATGNPQAAIASFQFTPSSGRAFVASRMRLARSQDVVAVAELSGGQFVMARKAVKVTIGGCGS